MKKEWKRILKRIGVFALTAVLLLETAAGNVINVRAGEDGTHVYLETYLDGVLDSTQDLGVKTGHVEVPIPQLKNYRMLEIWVDGTKTGSTGYCGFSMNGKTEDVTVRFYFEANRHTITFFDSNGSNATENPINVSFNQKLQYNQVPDTLKDGTVIITGWLLTGGAYEEFGWEIGKTYTKDEILSMRVGSDMTFKAVGNIPADSEFVVIFMDDDKTTELAKVTTVDRSAEYPNGTPQKEAVRKDGYLYTYTFIDWVDAAGVPVVLKRLTADRTVYASYRENKELIQEYTVVAKAGDGKFADGTKEKTYEGIAVGTAPALETPQIETVINGGVKTEYTFTGWTYTDAAGKTVNISDAKAGDVITAKAGFEQKVTTLYYTVKTDAANGTPVTSQQVQVSRAPSLENPSKADTVIDGVRTRYTFKGWKFTVNGTEITDLSSVQEGTEVLAQAQYSENKTTLYYNVIIDEKNGSATTSQQVQVSREPNITIVPEKAPVIDKVNGTKTEYTFAGWEFKDEQNNAVIPSKAAEGQTIYANATYTSVKNPIYYTVVIDKNNGEPETSEPVQVGKLPNLAAPEKAPVTENGKTTEYIFTGWEYTDENGNEINPKTAEEGAAVYATAQYAEKKLVYTVNYDAMEGAFADGSKKISAEVAVGSAPAAVETPVRQTTTDLNGVSTVYEFIGWNWIDNATGKAVTDLTLLEAGATVTARAVYKATEQSYKVIVQYKNGSLDNEYTVALGSHFVPPVTPEKADETNAVTGIVTTYEFAGWKYEKEDQSVAVPSEAKAGDVIYAKATYTATEQKYTVFYDANGGAFSNSETTLQVEAATGTVPAEAESPVRGSDVNEEGFELKYTFEKWVYTDENAATVNDLAKVPAGSTITASAQYICQEQSYTVTVNKNNGEEIADTKVKTGESPALETPVKDASVEGNERTVYTFDKWVYTDADGKEVNPSKTPSGEKITATAVYITKTETITYTVTVDENNGTTPTEQEVPIGTNPTLDTPVKPSEEKDGERTDFEFKEWVYEDEDGNPIDPAEAEEGQQITATATYTETKSDLMYTVRVDEANGTAAYDETVKVGTAPALGTPVKADGTGADGFVLKYTFESWKFTDASKNEVTDLTKAEKDEVIYAEAQYTYVEQSYMLYVDAKNGDEVLGNKVRVGEEILLGRPSKAATEENGVMTQYTFEKWEYEDSEGGSYTKLSDVPVGKVVTATAVYTETKSDLTYTVRVDEANGNEVYGMSLKVGTAPSLKTPEKAATVIGNQRTTYTFSKWVYKNAEGFATDPATAGKNETIYATAEYDSRTETITYTVTVDENNGTIPTEQEVPIGTNPTLDTPVKPSEEKDGERTDFEFKEWVYEDENGNPIDPAEAEEGQQITATAAYTETKVELFYQVMVDEANGKRVYETKAKVGTAPLLGNPVKQSTVAGNIRTIYTFDKWIYTDAEGQAIDPATVGENEIITATANYTASTETISVPAVPVTPTPIPGADPTPTEEPEPADETQPELMPPVIVPVPPTEPEPEELVEIEDEEPALEDGSHINDEAREVVVIEEEEVALGAMEKEDGCFIHWIILILSAAYVIFAGVRIADRRHKIKELEDKRQKQTAQE